MINEQLRQDVLKFLNRLDERERTTLVKRYGLNGSERQTLDAVGRKFKIARERFPQIQKLTVNKLRMILEQQEQPRPAADFRQTCAVV